MRRFAKTLHGKTAIVLCLVLLLSITVIGIHRRTVRRYGTQQQLAAIRQQNAVYAAALNTSFEMLEENLFYLPTNNRNFQELRRYDNRTPDTAEYWAMVSNIRQQLATLNATCPYVECFFIYYPAQDLFLNDRVDPEMTLRIRAMVADGADPLTDAWLPVPISTGSALLRIYAQRGFYLGAWVRCDSLTAWVADGDADRTFLYTAAGEPLSAGAPIAQLDAANAQGTAGPGDGQLLAALAEHPGVYLARHVPNAELRAAVRLDQNSFFIMCLLHVALLLFVLLAMSLWVLRPIRALSAGIGRIRGGELDFRMPPAPSDSVEFQDIQQEFNAMLDETQQMRIRMYEQQLQQDEVKLRYLSQQIQPHFILNSLNMLYAYIGRDDELSRRLIRLLARYYRYIINIESQYVEIGQEMDHLENYLSFQKVRYAERLQYAIDCEPSVRAVPIPPLLLESFVGNALKYGQDGEDRIHIRVSARRPDDATVRIRVADGGSGFPEEILDALRTYQRTGEKDELLGVGICNSVDRLRLIYGKDADIYFYNDEARGAVVEIVIRRAEDRQGEGQAA